LDDVIVGFGRDKLDIFGWVGGGGVWDNRFILLLNKRKALGVQRNGVPLPEPCLIMRLGFKNRRKFVLKFPDLIIVKNVGLL
jgi:hypothetical protein